MIGTGIHCYLTSVYTSKYLPLQVLLDHLDQPLTAQQFEFDDGEVSFVYRRVESQGDKKRKSFRNALERRGDVKTGNRPPPKVPLFFL